MSGDGKSDALTVDPALSPLHAAGGKGHRVEFTEPTRESFTFSVGMEVEANFGGVGEWYSAIIRGEKEDGTFDIEYDYGDLETQVPPERLRLPVTNGPRYGVPGETDLSARSSYSNITHQSPMLGISNPMLPQYYNNNESDTVASIDELGSLGEGSQIAFSPRVDTIFDPLPVQSKHQIPNLPLGGDDRQSASDPTLDTLHFPAPTPVYHLEDRVEADYFGRGKWYRGTVKKIREGPKEVTYDVHYDDGEIEVRVEEQRLRILVVNVHTPADNLSPEAPNASTGDRIKDSNPGSHRESNEQPEKTVHPDSELIDGSMRSEAPVKEAVEPASSAPPTSDELASDAVPPTADHNVVDVLGSRPVSEPVSEKAEQHNAASTPALTGTTVEQAVDELLAAAAENVSRRSTPHGSRPVSAIPGPASEKAEQHHMATEATTVNIAHKLAEKQRDRSHENEAADSSEAPIVEPDAPPSAVVAETESAEAPSAEPEHHMVDAAATVNIASKLASKSKHSTAHAWPADALLEGTRVEANYRHRGKWYPGAVQRAREDEEDGERVLSYDVAYDDGEIEVRVEASRVRVLGSSGEAAASEPSTAVAESRESDPVVESARVSSKEEGADALPAAVSEEKETEGSASVKEGPSSADEAPAPADAVVEAPAETTAKATTAEVVAAVESVPAAETVAAAEPASLESIDHAVESFVQHTVSDAVEDVSHGSHKHVEEARGVPEATEDKESSPRQVSGHKDEAAESKSDDSVVTEHKSDTKETDRPSSSSKSREPLSLESIERGVDLFIGHTLADAVDDVASHSHKHLDEAKEHDHLSEKPCEAAKDSKETKPLETATVVEAKDESPPLASAPTEPESTVAVKEPSPRPSASEIVPTIPLDDNQRAKDASVVDILDGLQYNGPAISQRKALRDLHTAQSEQKEQLTSSLSRVSAMKQALQSRQLALNNATRKAKGVLADIQDHLELMKKSSPSSGSDVAADTSVSQ